jgi:hypothetical protein
MKVLKNGHWYNVERAPCGCGEVEDEEGRIHVYECVECIHTRDRAMFKSLVAKGWEPERAALVKELTPENFERVLRFPSIRLSRKEAADIATVLREESVNPGSGATCGARPG